MTPGSGISFFRIPDLGSRVTNPYFWELCDNFLGKKFYNFLKIGPIFLNIQKMKWWQHPGSATMEFWMQIISIGLRNCRRWCDLGSFILFEIAPNLKGWQEVLFLCRTKWIDLRMKGNFFLPVICLGHLIVSRMQCCETVTIFYGSGSDLWHIPVLAPDPVPAVLRPWNGEKHSFQRKFWQKILLLVLQRKLFTRKKL